MGSHRDVPGERLQDGRIERPAEQDQHAARHRDDGCRSADKDSPTFEREDDSTFHQPSAATSWKGAMVRAPAADTVRLPRCTEPIDAR
jgi:hypothetical protein